jgi:hypothetical protein
LRTRDGTVASPRVAHGHSEAEIAGSRCTRNTSLLVLRVRARSPTGSGLLGHRLSPPASACCASLHRHGRPGQHRLGLERPAQDCSASLVRRRADHSRERLRSGADGREHPSRRVVPRRDASPSRFPGPLVSPDRARGGRALHVRADLHAGVGHAMRLRGKSALRDDRRVLGRDMGRVPAPAVVQRKSVLMPGVAGRGRRAGMSGQRRLHLPRRSLRLHSVLTRDRVWASLSGSGRGHRVALLALE